MKPNKMNRAKVIFLSVLAGILALLVISGAVVYFQISADKDAIAVAGKFSAKRNEVGVWKIEADSVAHLGFAFGCVQAHDRLFQTELMRRLGTGRLSEWFGDITLSRDRLMRFGSEVARWEWKQISDNPEYQLTKILLESYIEGRKQCLTSAPTPLEFRLMKADIASAGDWSPWEILAITRAHASDFSYDYRDEVGRNALKEFFGEEYAKILAPPEDQEAPALYDQVATNDLVNPSEAKRKSLWPSQAYFPEVIAAKSNKPNPIMNASHHQGFDLAGLGSFTGASNAWVAKSKTQSSANLCNDTHLGYLWPSTLYPVEYVLSLSDGKKVSGSGFSLPGVPALNIGRVIREVNGVRENVLEWGITIANFIDTQNLVKLDSQRPMKEVAKVQNFLVVDPKSHARKELQFNEVWTDMGPKVAGLTDWMGAQPNDGNEYALFWPAFRKEMSAVQFFALRTINGGDRLVDEFRYWQYPSVNFNWLEWDKASGVSAGHKMTGTAIQATSVKQRASQFTFLNSQEAMALLKSDQQDRPYIRRKINSEDEFYYATGNHRIYSGDLGLSLAYHWHEGSRAQRLVELRSANLQDPAAGQKDIISIEATKFLNLAMAILKESDLCQNHLPESNTELKNCAEIIKGLQEFKGEMKAQDWRPTVVSLWEREFKVGLWPKDPRDQTEPGKRRDWMELHKWWDRSGQSAHALYQILASPVLQKKVAAVLGKDIKAVLLESWSRSMRALAAIDASYKNWKWADRHQVTWQHPFLRLPGSLGKVMKGFVFPEGPAMDGSTDTPNVQQYYWTVQDPTDFSSVHGPVMRTCMSLSQDGATTMKISNITGISGNPFSEYSKKLSQDYYFAQKYFTLTE